MRPDQSLETLEDRGCAEVEAAVPALLREQERELRPTLLSAADSTSPTVLP